LFWFSGIYSNDPNHEMFDDIKKAFTRFEVAYVTYLSKQDNIPVSSIEESIEEQMKSLKNMYKSTDILAMYMLRQINQMQRESENKSIDFFGYMRNFLKKYQSINDSKTVDVNEIVELLEPHFGFKVSNKNWKSINAYEIVYKETGIINSIYTDVLSFRDEYSVRLIKEKLQEYDRLFIMM